MWGRVRGGSLLLTLTCSAADIRDKASATGVRLGRAHLARVTPGTTNGGTAEGLGAHNATQLTLAHLVVDLREAGTGPVVCEKDKEDKREKEGT